MQRFNSRTMRIATALIVLLICSVLGAWYVHMKSATAKIDVISVSRGLSSVVPSFFGSVGSTESNISGILGFLTGGWSGSASSTEAAPRLWHVSDTPVAGARFFGTGSTTVVRFIDRSSGHMIEAAPADSSVRRITNTLIPHVYQAFFTSTSTVILQSLSDTGSLLSVVASVQAATGTEAKLVGTSLPQNMYSLAVSPDGQKLFMVLPDGNGGSVGIVSDVRGGSQNRVFFSGLTQWRAQWPMGSQIIVVQRASDGIPGTALSLTPAGAISSLLENIPGLVVSGDASGARLYSAANGQTLSLFATNAKGKRVSVSLHTTAEKCVVRGSSAYCAVPETSPEKTFLRDWYRGSVHTEDALWSVNLETGASERILQFVNEMRVSVDVKKVFLSDDGVYLGFQNAVDSSLWILRIKS